MSGGPAAEARQRLDVWLWRARFAKSRTAAADRVAAGEIRIARAGQSRTALKPAELVSVGDVLTLPGPAGLLTLRILALGARRGPAEEARSLYAIISGA